MTQKDENFKLVYAVLLGIFIGFLFTFITRINVPDMSNMESEGHSHVPLVPNTQEHEHSMHMTLEVDHSNVPRVDLVVHEDKKSGWNLQILTRNFVFSPEGVSSDHVQGEGHAHIYVNDVKINRIYGEWYHISTLEPGENTIRVTLNANSHEDLTYNGQKIEDSEVIQV